MSSFVHLQSNGAAFSHSQSEELIFHQRDLIQLFPFGLSLAHDESRPFLLLKDEGGLHTLPVAINPLEAGVTLTQANKAVTPTTPHRVTALLLEALNVQPLQCVFVQIKGVHQFVRIYFQGHPQMNSLKVRADEAMSLCLHLGIPLYATAAFINLSKVMTAEIEGLTQGLKKPGILKNPQQPYVI